MFQIPHASIELRSLNYDNTKIENFLCLPMKFDGDILFELVFIQHLTNCLRQIQGMDRKYNGHAWDKMKMTNIKTNFELGFRSTQCLGHLCVKITLVRSLCAKVFAMKLLGWVILLKFQCKSIHHYILNQPNCFAYFVVLRLSM